MDSNFQYAEAVKLVVAPFLRRLLGTGGVLRFTSFLCAASHSTEPGSYDIDGVTPLALIAARFEDRVHLAESLHRGQSAAGSEAPALTKGVLRSSAPELYVLPDEKEPVGSEWRIAIPEAIRVGHDAAFGAFTRRFLACVADPASLSARETPNLLAKYRVTTGTVAISRR